MEAQVPELGQVLNLVDGVRREWHAARILGGVSLFVALASGMSLVLVLAAMWISLPDAVRWCYKEMVALLCTQASVSGVAALTPREFAGALRARGMEDEHVDRLTAIFEQVRYGGRPGIAFADEATACLDAIRVAYEPSVSS